MDAVETTNCVLNATNTAELGNVDETSNTAAATNSNDHTWKDWLSEKYTFLKEEKNLGAITWLTTLCTTLAVAYLKLIKYVSECGKLAYWNLPFSIIDVSSDNVVYDIIMSVVFASVMAAFLLIPFLIVKSKLKPLYKVVINCLLAVIISASLFLSGNTQNIVLTNGWPGVLAFIITDILFLVIFFIPSLLIWVSTLPPKHSNAAAKKTIVPLLVFFLIFSTMFFYFSNHWSAKNETRYRITHDGYAIVYETSDYYYLARYDTENKTIDKNVQKVIAKVDIEFTWTTVNTLCN